MLRGVGAIAPMGRGVTTGTVVAMEGRVIAAPGSMTHEGTGVAGMATPVSGTMYYGHGSHRHGVMVGVLGTTWVHVVGRGVHCRRVSAVGVSNLRIRGLGYASGGLRSPRGSPYRRSSESGT